MNIDEKQSLLPGPHGKRPAANARPELRKERSEQVKIALIGATLATIWPKIG
jgi:hypothetical protein